MSNSNEVNVPASGTGAPQNDVEARPSMLDSDLVPQLGPISGGNQSEVDALKEEIIRLTKRMNQMTVTNDLQNDSKHDSLEALEMKLKEVTDVDSVEVTLADRQRIVNLVEVPRLEESLENFEVVEFQIKEAISHAGIQAEVQKKFWEGKLLPSESVHQLLRALVYNSAMNLDDRMVQYYQKMPGNYSAILALKYLQQMFEEGRDERMQACMQQFKSIMYDGGALKDYNNKFMKLYDVLIKSNKMVASEFIVDLYLRSLGSSEFASMTRVDVQRDPKIRAAYLCGDVMKVSDRAMQNYRIMCLNQEYAVYPVNQVKVATSNEVKPNQNGSKSRKKKHKKIKCYNCGAKGHGANECKHDEPKCFNCNEFGHISDTCPLPNKNETDQKWSKVNMLVGNLKGVGYNKAVQVLVDSGAATSVTNELGHLNDVKPCDMTLQLPNGMSIQAEKEGIYDFFGIGIRMIYSPEFQHTLLGVADLVNEGFVLQFSQEGGQVQKDSKVVASMTKVGKLFSLQPTLVANVNAVGDPLHLHKCYGHSSAYRLQLKSDSFVCDACTQANITLGNKNKVDTQSIRMQDDAVYCDYKVLQQGLILVMVETRFNEVGLEFMRSKSQARDAVSRFLNSLSYTPKQIVVDTDAPWTSKEFRRFIKIPVQFIPPERHGFLYAERVIQEVGKSMRVLWADIPEQERKDKLLPYMVKYVEFNLNRVYWKRIGTSPFRARNPESKMNLDLFKPFYAKVVYRAINRNKSLDPKGSFGQFLGIALNYTVPTVFILAKPSGRIVARAFNDVHFIPMKVNPVETPVDKPDEIEPKVDSFDASSKHKKYKDLFKTAFQKGIMIDDDEGSPDPDPHIEVDDNDLGVVDVNDVEPDEVNDSSGEESEREVNELHARRYPLRQRRQRELYDITAEMQKPQLAPIGFIGLVTNVTKGFHLPKASKEVRKKFTAPILQEVANLYAHDTIEQVDKDDLPDDAVVINSQFVLETKRNGKYKARLVARGDEMKNSSTHNYSPTINNVFILLILMLANMHPELMLTAGDVSSAFLHGKQELKNLFMRGGYPMDRHVVFKIKKNLYGTTNAAKIWYHCFREALETFGLFPCDSDPCFFKSKDHKTFLIIHVDDFLILGPPALVDKFFAYVDDLFQVTRTELHDFLGFQLRSTGGSNWILSQKDYIVKVLERFGLHKSKPQHTPMAVGRHMIEDGVQHQTDPDNKRLFQQMVGCLNYLHLGRPDIDYAVLCLATQVTNPQPQDFSRAKRVFRYLQGTKDLAIAIRNQDISKAIEVKAYVDASFTFGKRFGTTGFVVFFNGIPVAHGSKKQKVVSDSSTYAEMLALAHVMKELLFLKIVAHDMGFKLQRPVIFVDNISVINLLEKSHAQKSRHFLAKILFCRDNLSHFDVEYVPTDQNIADMFTKALPNDLFRYHRSALM